MTSTMSSPSTRRIGGGPLLPLRLSMTILSDTMLGGLLESRLVSSTMVVLTRGLRSRTSTPPDRSLRLDLLCPRLEGPSRLTICSFSPVIVQEGDTFPDRKNNSIMMRIKPATEPSTIPATAPGAGPSTLYTLGMTAVPCCRLVISAVCCIEGSACGILFAMLSATPDVRAATRGSRSFAACGSDGRGIGAIVLTAP